MSYTRRLKHFTLATAGVCIIAAPSADAKTLRGTPPAAGQTAPVTRVADSFDYTAFGLGAGGAAALALASAGAVSLGARRRASDA